VDAELPDPRDGDAGTPVGRRIVLGLGALGLGGRRRRPRRAGSALLAPVASHDPTGLTTLVP
jgi:hypothetical protein